METVSTLEERRILTERRISGDRRAAVASSKTVDKTKTEQTEMPKRYGFAFEVLSTVVVICIALAVYKVTGLFDAIESTLWKAGFGVVFSYCYVGFFRHSFYTNYKSYSQ